MRLLQRIRCRIPLGEPGESGEHWSGAPDLPAPDFTWIGSGRVPRTRVRALAGAAALCVRFDCAVNDFAFLGPRDVHQAPSVGPWERAWIEVSPCNDFSEWWRFTADFRGAREAARRRQMPGENNLGEAPDVWRKALPCPLIAADWQVFHGVCAEGWWVEMSVPWRAIGLASRPRMIGFGYGRAYVEDRENPVLVEAHWMNAETRRQPLLDTGEALIGPDAGAPEALEIDPRFGRNTGRILLGADWPRRPAVLRARVEMAEGKTVSSRDFAVPAQDGEVAFEYDLDRALSSHLDVFQPPRLALELRAASEEAPLYHVRLPMDRHLGTCVDEPYGERGEGTCDRLDGIIRALPRLRRATTAQGAPSDFCLLREDGSVAVNLMADDAWRRLAEIVERAFATAEDRLLGAMALVAQKSVTNLVACTTLMNAEGLPAWHSALHELMGPLSLVRYGGGPAVCRAAALARLLQHVRDPKTGRPFVTRVVSLTRDGGPSQVTRRYASGMNVSPFVQRPGPVGAVAVEYGGGLTLLDPTALAFFAAGGGKLATIEQMLADERIRQQGAGRLATVYEKVDIEEVLRQPPDALLSKGVFPELCPDEEGPDRPFTMRQAHAPLVIVVPKGRESAPAEGFRDLRGNPAARAGNVRLSWDDAGLTVRVLVRGASPASLDARDREMERVHLAIDPTLGHAHFHHFQMSLSGERKLWQEQSGGIQTLYKHLTTEHVVECHEVTDAAWSAEAAEAPDGYEAEFRAPWSVLGADAAPAVIGLNVWVDHRAPRYGQAVLAPPRWRMAADAYSFANVYLNGGAFAVAEIDLGVPAWGGNVGRATVSNSGPEAEVALCAENRLSMRRAVRRSGEARAIVPAGGSATVEFPYFLDPSEKMGTSEGQQVTLLARSGGKEFYRGSWRIGYCTTPAAYQRYGRAAGEAADPKPGEKNFIEKKIRFICSRLPEFRRLTTRDGAPSDFFLRAEDGSVEFNLMEAGVLDRMGEYVAGRFDNDLDRVLGIYYLSHAPPVARHLSGGHMIMAGAGPLSVMRGNFAGAGGNCGYHSRVFAGMAAHLKIGGEPLLSSPTSLWGHVIANVAWRGRRSLMDADVGHFFLTADGSGLAALEDLRAHPAQALTTAGPGELARYLTFHAGHVRARRCILREEWGGVFPPGAPRE